MQVQNISYPRQQNAQKQNFRGIKEVVKSEKLAIAEIKKGKGIVEPSVIMQNICKGITEIYAKSKHVTEEFKSEYPFTSFKKKGTTVATLIPGKRLFLGDTSANKTIHIESYPDNKNWHLVIQDAKNKGCKEIKKIDINF